VELCYAIGLAINLVSGILANVLNLVHRRFLRRKVCALQDSVCPLGDLLVSFLFVEPFYYARWDPEQYHRGRKTGILRASIDLNLGFDRR